MKKDGYKEAAWLDVFIGLAQATRFCRQDEAFCEGVTFHQFMILEFLAADKGLALSELHPRLGVAKSTTTRLVAPLLAGGLVKREADSQDGRAVRLCLTHKGRKTHADVRLCLSGFVKKVADHLPSSGREKTLQAVGHFIEAIRKAAREEQCCA